MVGERNAKYMALPGRGACSGFSLAEVLVSLLVVMILLFPLATRCLALFGRADAVIRRPLPVNTPGLAEWGPIIATAGLQAHELVVIPGEAPSPGPMVLGWWIDGWLNEELPVLPGESVRVVPGNDWESSEERELVIRVRSGQAPWGPPRRFMLSASSAAPSPDADANAGAVLIHLPEAGEFLIQPSWLPFDLTAQSPGRLSLVTGNVELHAVGQAQQWQNEPGRDLDVYY